MKLELRARPRAPLTTCSPPTRSSSSPSCSASSAPRVRAARGPRPSAARGWPRGDARLPARDRGCPRRATGRWPRLRPTCSSAGSRSPGRPSARWSSTRSTRAPTASWPTSRTPTRRAGGTWSRATSTCATRSSARSPTTAPTAATTSSATEPATLLVRPRGWHLPERHLLVDGEPVPASLFDFGLYFFHCAPRLLAAGQRPVLLPAQAGVPSRGAAVERRVLLRPGRARDRPAGRSRPPS